ncbi:SixA phosphatase family protein [Thiobacter aerophilum]|uniref:Histidine phosphatase family protein n=1 Tax=Thiobacter aerophilum TaxID=3121275 RepID=A0ABV0EBZ4_9BURK
MDLILWRHAEAEDGLPDKSRKLTAKGEKQARAMAAWLKSRLPRETQILSSPAKRALQTASALVEKPQIVPALDVGASAAAVLAAAGWPDNGTVVVVGHQPTLGRVAALLLAGEEQDWSVKKGAIWWFSNRVRGGEAQTVLRAVMAPDLL